MAIVCNLVIRLIPLLQPTSKIAEGNVFHLCVILFTRGRMMLLPILLPGPMFLRGGGLHSFRRLSPEGVSLQGVSPFRGGRQTHPSMTDILWNSSKRAVRILLEFNANLLTLDCKVYLYRLHV